MNVYTESNICNMNDVYKSILLLDFVYRYDVGKVLHKNCTSTFPIFTLTLMIMYYVCIEVHYMYMFILSTTCEIFV